MKYSIITEEELDQILDAQFNSPEFLDSFTKEDFYNEWKSTQLGIKAVLLKLGFKSWNDGGGDYTMADDWGYSRHHEVEINKEAMFSSKLLLALKGLVESLEKDYEIIVQHDLFLRHEIAAFHIVVRKNEVIAQTENPLLLRRFGLEIQ